MNENTISYRIGGKIFVISAKSSEKTKETLEDKLKKLVKREVIALAKSGENQ